ncbi:MAG: UDP-N-acetylmuramoyl-tripeptide--D-alanyl-D-alanine ligase [Weeksellaceae bacterium]|nr:UDP-N-acetylmuramoyl-tripeptide--D-alanyl-D-alanine ligase [Weeksellaceae bacterium]
MVNLEAIYKVFQQSTGVSTDSRKVKEGEMFFALSGPNFNGNTFAKSAVEQGALTAVIDDSQYSDVDYLLVENVLHTLQKLAKYHRQKMGIPIIALTGSNGKTTTKELMAAVLGKKFKVQFTQGNLNNHIGVPLTLLSIDTSHEIAIVEMGANHLNEIADLCEIAQPDIGYITNFGSAHLEGFGSKENIVSAKSELYRYLRNHDGSVLLNKSDVVQVSKAKDINSISFAFNQSANYEFEVAPDTDNATVWYSAHKIESQLIGDYNAANIAAAVSIGLHFQIPLEDIIQAVREYNPSNHRSQKISHGAKTIILDCYNANPSSMVAALSHFAHAPGKKAVILGDMFELGEFSMAEHTKIAELVSNLDFHEILFVGEWFSQTKIAHPNLFKFRTMGELRSFLESTNLQSTQILVKGSRGMRMEEIEPLIKK